MGLICKKYQADTVDEVIKVEEMLLQCLETQVGFFKANIDLIFK